MTVLSCKYSTILLLLLYVYMCYGCWLMACREITVTCLLWDVECVIDKRSPLLNSAYVAQQVHFNHTIHSCMSIKEHVVVSSSNSTSVLD